MYKPLATAFEPSAARVGAMKVVATFVGALLIQK
jgi:hypothetical protein